MTHHQLTNNKTIMLFLKALIKTATDGNVFFFFFFLLLVFKENKI